jgi:hypothetical protein
LAIAAVLGWMWRRARKRTRTETTAQSASMSGTVSGGVVVQGDHRGDIHYHQSGWASPPSAGELMSEKAAAPTDEVAEFIDAKLRREAESEMRIRAQARAEGERIHQEQERTRNTTGPLQLERLGDHTLALRNVDYGSPATQVVVAGPVGIFGSNGPELSLDAIASGQAVQFQVVPVVTQDLRLEVSATFREGEPRQTWTAEPH